MATVYQKLECNIQAKLTLSHITDFLTSTAAEERFKELDELALSLQEIQQAIDKEKETITLFLGGQPK